jgi:hypothetical protein
MPRPSSKSKLDTPSTALFGVALVQGIAGFYLWSTFGWEPLSLGMRIFALAGIFYFVLALVAKIAPLTAAVVGLIPYLIYLGLQAATDIRLLTGGWVHKVPITVFVLSALFAALRQRRRRQNEVAAASPTA